jgi:hypothetical protein
VTLLVHRLLDAAVLEDNATLLGETLFPGSSGDPEQSFHVSTNSGWLSYAHHGELFTDRPFQTLPGTEQEAFELAERFFADANTRIKESEPLRGAGLPPLFPAKAKRHTATHAWRRGQALADHWLCRYEVFLTSSHTFGARAAPLWGAGIDVRIGNGGRVVGLWLRYRTPVANLESSEVSPAEHGAHEGEHGVHEAHEGEPLLAYRAEGEYAPQTHYLPYHLSGAGHHLEFAPASEHSLMAGILEVRQADGTTLHAIVEGGSGTFDYAWGHWRIDADRVFVDAGTGESIGVGLGVFNVILNVVDRATGVMLQTQSVVYSAGRQPLVVS